MKHKITKTENYLLVVDNEDKNFTVGTLGLYKNYKLGIVTDCNEDILEFEKEYIDESNLAKVISHLPINGSPILEGVDLLPPYSRHQEDGVDNAVMEFKERYGSLGVTDYELSAFSKGYNKAREKFLYTELDVIHLLHKTARKYFQEGREYKGNMAIAGDPLHGVRKELIDMLQSLSQYPTEFQQYFEQIPCPDGKPGCLVNHYQPQTTTNNGHKVWVGRYI